MSEVESVVVRRRLVLLATITIASAGLAAAYLWLFWATQSTLDLVVAMVLGLLAAFNARACLDARTPLFVADTTGIRIRLGPTWTGVRWESVESLVVQERGRVRDGRVVVLADRSVDVLRGAGWRSRWAATLNRWLYAEPLAAPFGLTTSVSVLDVTASLERLADGRAPVVAGPHADEPGVELGVERVQAPASVAADRLSQPVTRGPLSTAAGGTPPRVAVATTAARREEVTIALRSEPATFGTLALSDPAEGSAQLPEIQELRRSPDPGGLVPQERLPDDGLVGNVSLVIDATTDLSARAMQKVRTSRAGTPDGPEASRTLRATELEAANTVIGGQLAQARDILGFTIDELSERTRIRASVIESIEVDDFAPCGGDFYAKGHLRMLARVLGLDAGPLLEAYDERFASGPVNARDVFEVELATGSTGLVRAGSSGANWGGLLAAVLVLLLVWGVARLVTDGLPASGVDSPTASTAPRSVAAPTRDTPAQTPVPPQAHVRLLASGGDSRVMVTDGSGHVVFHGKLSNGSAKKVVGEAPLRVKAADAGVISLSVRGRDLGVVGDVGTPAHRLVRAMPHH